MYIDSLSHSKQMEMLPAEDVEDESKMIEITDSKVLAHNWFMYQKSLLEF